MLLACRARSTTETDGGGFEPPDAITLSKRADRGRFSLYTATLMLFDVISGLL